MDSLYIIKKQLEDCKEKLADYKTRLCVNCKDDYAGCEVQESIKLAFEQAGNIIPNFAKFGCSNFERKIDD